jgi:tetratricopeptide (TPR) repeat protein
MGADEADWSLSELHGVTPEQLIPLLDRAAEVGLLAGQRGFYHVHPALPWYFRGLFRQCYPGRRTETERAFVRAMGDSGTRFHMAYDSGGRDWIVAMAAVEADLLHARRLALVHGWWGSAIDAMQGLYHLYDHTGQRPQGARLVAEIVPHFVDPATDGPLPGREDEWSVLSYYRVRLAREARDWARAEHLQRLLAEFGRRAAAPAIGRPAEALTDGERVDIRNLAVSLHGLGDIRRQLGQSDCVSAYREALGLADQIGESHVAATCAFGLGHAYKDIPALHDLNAAQRWYERSLELRDPDDTLAQARSHAQLGCVAHTRFLDARRAGRSEAELLRLLNGALRHTRHALRMLPQTAVAELGLAHNGLAAVYSVAGDLDRALPHFRDSIRYEEAQGSRFGAGVTRLNVAVSLARHRRFTDALEYARAALRDFETYGHRAAKEAEEARRLVAQIEADMAKGPAP